MVVQGKSREAFLSLCLIGNPSTDKKALVNHLHVEIPLGIPVKKTFLWKVFCFSLQHFSTKCRLYPLATRDTDVEWGGGGRDNVLLAGLCVLVRILNMAKLRICCGEAVLGSIPVAGVMCALALREV